MWPSKEHKFLPHLHTNGYDSDGKKKPDIGDDDDMGL